jgi:single-stranded DNA-binding protein
VKFDQQPPIQKSAPLLHVDRTRADQVARRQPPIPEAQSTGEEEMNTNCALVVGRLARAPQMRYVNDAAVVQMSVACSEGTETIIPVSVWGTEKQLRDLVPLEKGALVLVQGRLAKRSWEGLDSLEVVGSDVQILANSEAGAAVGPFDGRG